MTTLTIEVSEDLGEPRHLERRAGYLLNLRCRKLRTRLNAHATAHIRVFHFPGSEAIPCPRSPRPRLLPVWA